MKKYIKAVLAANNKIEEWNLYSLEEIVHIINLAYNIKIPDEVIEKFRFTGLSNLDLLTSNFLSRYNIILK